MLFVGSVMVGSESDSISWLDSSDSISFVDSGSELLFACDLDWNISVTALISLYFFGDAIIASQA